ncbi:MAG TPA: hypothetical protein VJB12_02835 [Candidatus Nanoarchaeia archaeon]|nr:hypothetical protein [Candidatus Nanoarchaeia archaeon]
MAIWKAIQRFVLGELATTVSPLAADPSEIKAALVECLDIMDTKGVDRAVLALYDRGSDINIYGMQQYHPAQSLGDREIRMIMGHKQYGGVALVGEGAANRLSHSGRGVESFVRTYFIPVLPQLKENPDVISDMKYGTLLQFHPQGDLDRFVQNALKTGWTPNSIRDMFRSGAEEYQAISAKAAGGVGAKYPLGGPVNTLSAGPAGGSGSF